MKSNWKTKVIALSNRLHIPVDLYFRLYTDYMKLANRIKYGDPDFPRGISLEISTYCNRRCGYCPISLMETVPKDFMTWDTFKAIIAKLQEINYSGSIYYHFFNEPLLDERIVEFVQYVTDHLPKAMSRIVSNGDPLNMELADQLFAAGVSNFAITDHNETPGKVEKRLKPIRDKYPGHITIGWIHDQPLDNRGGTVEVKQLNLQPTCTVISDTLHLDYQGNVLLCCGDFSRSVTFGNLVEEDLLEIWRKPRYQKIRQGLARGEAILPVCQQCNYVGFSGAQEDQEVEKGA